MIQVPVEDGSACLDSKKWIDVEVALSTCNAVARSFIVILDPISKRASMRYRKVDLDGSRNVRGKPVDRICYSTVNEENSVVSTYFRSTNVLRSNTPPSRGKLVLNTPFLDAGVPASSETRRIYGISAGGRRMYWINVVNVAPPSYTWVGNKTYLSTLAWATIWL